MNGQTLEGWLKDLIGIIVNNPDQVNIERKTDDMGVLLTVNVDPSDMGLLIGRAGETAKAVRHLVHLVGRKENANVSMKINEPAGSLRPPRKDYRENRPYPRDKRNVENYMDDFK